MSDLPTATPPTDPWAGLAAFKRFGSFGEQYPANVRRFFAPDDLVHEALVSVVKSARVSIACAMYGWDDDELETLFLDAMNDERIPVTLCLDKSQAGGVHERALLAKFPTEIIGNDVVIGQSRKHAISHLKLFVVDGLYTIGGSTNVSDSGETKQNNECVIIRDAVYAAETRAKIDLVHDEMRRQMEAAPAAPAGEVPHG